MRTSFIAATQTNTNECASVKAENNDDNLKLLVEARAVQTRNE
jgi:hypothetical protein